MAKSPKLDISYIAKLARLSLTDSEKERFSRELKDVLNHVEKLKELDLKNVLPTFQTTGSTDVVREDKLNDSQTLLAKESLANAKKTAKNHFRVPKVI